MLGSINKIYNVDIYIRLSRKDDDKVYESESITNQKNLLLQYVKENNLLDGLLYCGDCGHRISIQARRKKDNRCYTICNYYRTYMKQKLCTTHFNNYDELEKVIINSLTNMCLSYIKK